MINIFKIKQGSLYSPINGKVIKLEEVEDEVFSSKMMGDGIAFRSNDGIIYSPCDGVISMIPTTLHAFGLRAKSGLEVLVHVGLDTVNLQGNGFTKLVNEGASVKQGTPILKVDLDYMKRQNVNLVTPLIIMNSSEFTIDFQGEKEYVTKDDLIINYKRR